MSVTEFNYVVERRAPDRVCFLSTRPRGLYNKIKKQPSPGPYSLENTSALYKITHKVRSKLGVGGLAATTPRFGKVASDDVPGPKLGFDEPVIVKDTKYPFGSKLPRWGHVYSNVPGPGNYATTTLCKTTKMCQTFGGPRKMKPAIDIICVARPSDKCEICQEVCDGDYWHLDETIYMCNVCMIIERFYNKKYSKRALRKFKRIRNCSFMHRHEGTTAAIRLLPNKLIVMKARKENYLNLFLKPY